MTEIESLQGWVDAMAIGAIITSAVALVFLILGFYWKKYATAEKIVAIVAAFFTVVLSILGFVWNKNLNQIKDIEAATLQKESERKIKEARQDVSKIQTELTPRVLIPEQRSDLLKYFKSQPPGKVDVLYVANNLESEELAKQFASVLTEAGWTVQLISHIDISGTPKGLTLRSRDRENPFAQTLGKGLTAAQVPVKGEYNPEYQETLLLIIGVKP